MTQARIHQRAGRLPAAEAGFVLPTAIFLLVVLAGLAGFMVTLSRTSHMSGALDIQGGRAYQAARAGMEWAAWQVVQNPTPLCTAASTTLAPLSGTLASFTVTVSCTPFGPYVDGADTVAVYQVTSTATSGVAGNVDYVERQIQANFGK
jgi:MSHA biogenesis protein MshP